MKMLFGCGKNPTSGFIKIFNDIHFRKMLQKRIAIMGALIEHPGFYDNLTGRKFRSIARLRRDLIV